MNQTLYQVAFFPFYFLHDFRQCWHEFYFSVVTRRWHLSSFTFLWFSLNHMNRLSVQFSCLRICINQNHMCETYYQQHNLQNHTHIFYKRYHRDLYWKEADFILNFAELDMLHQHSGCWNFLFLFFVFFR